MTELWKLDATELAQGIRTRRWSSREAVEACLSRLHAVNPAINAVVDVLEASAREAAEAAESAIREAKKEVADRGKAPKTLQGVPAAAPADDTDANPFAYLDRLSGEKLEAAVEKLSPEDRVRWAHSQ